MCKTILLCLWILGTRLFAAQLSLTDLNDAQSIRLFRQLVSEQWATPAEEVQATADAMSSLLIYLAPNIKKIPGYAGLFAGNCSVFFSNKTIEQVGCNIIPVSLVSANAADQIKEATPLPAQYATQITQSNILLASLFADWTRKIAQKVERFQVDLFLKVETCTRTMSQTETQSQSETSLSKSLSKTAINSSTLTELLSKTASASKTILPSVSQTQANSETGTKSLSQTTSTSQSSSKTLSDAATSTMTRMSGLLAAWNSSSGAYDDGTSQLGRYNASNGVVTDTFAGLQWQQASSNTTMSWNDAVLYCSNRTTGGFNDWQLPNNAELESLVDYAVNFQGQTPGINAIFSGTPTNYFYSSTPLVGSVTQQPWWMSFGQNAYYPGLLCNQESVYSCSSVSAQGYVRCVRSPYHTLPADRYAKTSDTVTDTITGLIWQRVSTGGTMIPANALAHCCTLNLVGFSSAWRLPTVKELATLVDYNVAFGNLMMDELAFAGEYANAFWSSSLVPGLPAYAWYVTFNNGNVQGSNVARTFYARCVACPIPPATGVLAAWSQAGGTYEDSTIQIGRYNVSNGIVTDTLTSIQWQQNASTTTMNWTDAATYCANQTTGGFNGWRVPNIIELQTLVDYTTKSSYVNSAVFPGVLANWFWSSTPDAGNAGNSWDVHPGSRNHGYFLSNTRNNRFNVFCVRSCYPVFTRPRYKNIPGEVTDLVTGLVWQQTSRGPITWASAFTYCAGLTLNNHPWRLPTIKELATLVDYSINQGNLTMDSTVFSGQPAWLFWSSTLAVGDPSYAWYVYFAYGYVNINVVTASIQTRCVACSVPPTTGLLAIWNQAGGTYADSTNQTGRYNVSNGIVTDTLTELQWQQNASSTAMNWTNAATYCTNQTTGGLSGWRVPNIIELGTLLDYTSLTSPYLDTTAFPGPPVSNFWSASSNIGHSGYSWCLNWGNSPFHGGRSYYYTTGTTNPVRCVRSCYSISPSSRYTNVSGEVTDSVTNLIWQQVSTGGTMTQIDAVTHCTGLGLNSHTWRLPTIRELSTLVDYSASYGTLMMNTTVFAGEPASWFWSSTLLAGTPSSAWDVLFNDGHVTYSTGSDCFVRCVR